MTTAFLGLLDKGSRDVEGYTSSVVNITSISGILKIAQRHVSTSAIAFSWLAGVDPMTSSHITARKQLRPI